MFSQIEIRGKRVLESSLINDDGVVAFLTSRDLPLKLGERQDLIEEVAKSKKIICDELEIPYENLIIPIQTHSSNIGIVSHTGETFENTDALITNIPNIAIALNFADCVPIIFYDKVKKVIACAHAGWRGTVAQIGVKTIEKMIEEFSCSPKDITAIIGASIGKCCFEVKPDVLEKLKNSIPEEFHSIFSETHADLKLINKIQLATCGLENIDVCEYCTSCSSELFFSYRRENGYTARHSAVIMLKETK